MLRVFAQKAVSEFLDALSARTPTPGGGSAGALAAAAGTSLAIMAVRFSDGAAPAHERELDRHRKAFEELIDRDARAYESVRRAAAMPRRTRAEKDMRRNALRDALLSAARAPLDGILGCEAVSALLEGFAPRCNPNLRSDLACAVILVRAAARVLERNVRVNLASLGPGEQPDRLGARMEKALHRIDELSEKILESLGS